MSITVKVVRVPGAIAEVELEEGATVADALEYAGIEMHEGEGVKVGKADGSTSDATTSTTVSNGDKVVIAKGAKGA